MGCREAELEVGQATIENSQGGGAPFIVSWREGSGRTVVGGECIIKTSVFDRGNGAGR
jgi:hypothetical protein